MIWKGRCDDMESKHEYLENMSRRNNIKILGLLEDKLKEKSWDDTEELVKGVTKEKLKFDTEVKIERAHRVGKPRALSEITEDGSRKKIPPRPTCMLEIEGSYSASCKRRQVKAKNKGNAKQKKFVFSRTFRQEHCRGEVIKYPS